MLERQLGSSLGKEDALDDNSFRSLFCHLGKSGLHLVRASGHRDRRDLNPGGLSGEIELVAGAAS